MTPVPINCKKHGFTLIELLLVIVILGVLTTLALAMYQRHAANFKIQKTAAQMQALLQAAADYYADNGCWPNSLVNSSICPPKQPIQYNPLCYSENPPSFDDYIPIGISQTPWPAKTNHYWCQPEPTKGKKFQVMTDALPSQTISQQIAAQLPSTTWSGQSPFPAQAEIAQPPSAPPQYWIAKMGTTGDKKDGDNININFTCPSQWVGKATMMVRSFSAFGQYLDGCGLNCRNAYQSLGIGKLYTTPFNCSNADTNWSCSSNLTFQSYTGMKGNPFGNPNNPPYATVPTGNVNYFYIAWCVPNSNSTASPLPIF